MPITSLIEQGTLSGIGVQNTLRTATASNAEAWTIVFVNLSGSEATLTVWVNGVANKNLIVPPSTKIAESGSTVVAGIKADSGAILYAEGGTSGSIVWTNTIDTLSI